MSFLSGDPLKVVIQKSYLFFEILSASCRISFCRKKQFRECSRQTCVVCNTRALYKASLCTRTDGREGERERCSPNRANGIIRRSLRRPFDVHSAVSAEPFGPFSGTTTRPFARPHTHPPARTPARPPARSSARPLPVDEDIDIADSHSSTVPNRTVAYRTLYGPVLRRTVPSVTESCVLPSCTYRTVPSVTEPCVLTSRSYRTVPSENQRPYRPRVAACVDGET